MPESKRPKTEDEKARNLKAIWEHTNKDMPLQEFIRQGKDLMDPNKMVEDLGDIKLAKARQRMNKIRIDKACQN